MRIRYLFLSLLLALFLSACGGSSAPDPDATRTSAALALDSQLAPAQTEAAQQTRAARTATAQASAAAAQATATRALVLTSEADAAALAEATEAALEPQLFSREAAACRVGPDTGFASRTQLVPFEVVDVLARSTDGEWWQVVSPNDSDSSCWVFWRSDLELIGDVHNLPLVEGPSLPVATSTSTREPGISLHTVDNITCAGVEYAMVSVSNNGPDTYQSAIVTISDLDAGVEISRQDGNNEFLPSPNSCPKGNPTLGPGQQAYLVASIKNVADGTSLRMHVRLCTEKAYQGDCVRSSISFGK